MINISFLGLPMITEGGRGPGESLILISDLV